MWCVVCVGFKNKLEVFGPEYSDTAHPCTHDPRKKEKKMKLWDHQKNAVKFCLRNMIPKRGKPRGVVLAHEMGLGKTLSTVAVVSELSRRNVDVYPLVLVAPLSMLQHWKDTFDQCANFVDTAEVIHSDNKDRLPMYQCQVWIMTYSGAEGKYRDLVLKRCKAFVVDEASKLKKPDSLFTKLMTKLASTCNYRLLLTATPIENSVQEFHTLMNVAQPGWGGSARTFKVLYHNPLKKGCNSYATPQQKLFARKAAAEIFFMAKPFLQRKLAPKRQQTDVCVQVQMTKPQAELYARTEAGHQTVFKKQRAVQINGATVYESYMDPIGRALQQRQMAELWSVVNGTHAHMANVDTGKKVWLRTNFTKLVAGGQIAVFFKYLATLRDAETLLDELGISSVVIDGSRSFAERQDALDAMNDKRVQVLLGTSRSCGYGINLLTVDKILLVEVDWNAAIDLQTAARGSRPGNPHQITVFRLVTPETIESMADETASAKITLARLVLDDRVRYQAELHTKATEAATDLLQQPVTSFDMRASSAEFHFRT